MQHEYLEYLRPVTVYMCYDDEFGCEVRHSGCNWTCKEKL